MEGHCMTNVRNIAHRRQRKRLKYFALVRFFFLDPSDFEIRGITDSSGVTQWTKGVEVIQDLGFSLNNTTIKIDIFSDTLTISCYPHEDIVFTGERWS